MQRREKQRKLSLHEEIEREAQQIEQELENHPELKSLVVTEEMDTALFEKIYGLENKGRRKKKREIHLQNFRKNLHRIFFLYAAKQRKPAEPQNQWEIWQNRAIRFAHSIQEKKNGELLGGKKEKFLQPVWRRCC